MTTQTTNSNSDPLVQVLCGCGWGSLGMPESEVPCECPLCGNTLRAAESDQEPSDDWYDDQMDGDAESALASAGWGTDEDYGAFDGEDF